MDEAFTIFPVTANLLSIASTFPISAFHRYYFYVSIQHTFLLIEIDPYSDNPLLNVSARAVWNRWTECYHKIYSVRSTPRVVLS